MQQSNDEEGQPTPSLPIDGCGPSNPFPCPVGSSLPADDDDDVLQYLNFSDTDRTDPPALPAPQSDEPNMEASDAAMQDPAFWGFNEHLLAKGWTGVNPEDGNPGTSALPGEEDGNLGMPGLDGQQMDCSGCLILREVVHTNGLQNMKLVIHGGLGAFYHAWIDVQHNTDGVPPPATQRSYIDFSTQSFDRVKQFLVDYGLVRTRDQFFVIQDSLSAFCDALCVRMCYYEVGSTSASARCLPESGLHQSGPIIDDNRPIKIPKTGIAAKRERTGKLKLSDIADYFHLPISEAAVEIAICPTALKKVCRRNGLTRWPHRKIKSIDNMISKLERCLRDGVAAEENASTIADIERLRAQRAQLCAGLPP